MPSPATESEGGVLRKSTTALRRKPGSVSENKSTIICLLFTAIFNSGVNPLTGEVGGPAGPEPTRYGDWERKGRCIDF